MDSLDSADSGAAELQALSLPRRAMAREASQRMLSFGSIRIHTCTRVFLHTHKYTHMWTHTHTNIPPQSARQHIWLFLALTPGHCKRLTHFQSSEKVDLSIWGQFFFPL